MRKRREAKERERKIEAEDERAMSGKRVRGKEDVRREELANGAR